MESELQLSQDELQQLHAEPPKEPLFPILITLAAVIKDLADVPGDLSLIGIIITTVLSLILALILFIWTYLHAMHGGLWKKRLISKLWKRYIISIAIEFLPWVKIIPANTIFILLTYYQETKLVKILNSMLGKMH